MVELENFRRIGNTSNVLGESPVWSVAEQALYWVDIRGGLLQRWRATITSASSQFSEEERKAKPLEGGLFAFDTSVTGIAPDVFGDKTLR